MYDSIMVGLSGFTTGPIALFTTGLPNLVMLFVAGVLIYLGVKKDVEPLLLVPIGFGCLIANIPFGDLASTTMAIPAGHEIGFLQVIYDAGIKNELFPLLIFVGIGAMTDFGPLLENPKILLFGAAGQCGIFLTLMLALLLGFSQMHAMAISIIGACDGPTSIYVASRYAPDMLGPISVAAYSYMALVPIIQPKVMHFMTTQKERVARMGAVKKSVSANTRLLFPIVVTIVTGLIAPKGLPLMATIMLGNFMRESGAVERLKLCSENELANIATLFLGLAVGSTMEGHAFLKTTTLAIFGLGFVAIVLDTVVGVGFGKLMYLLTGGKVNPLVGAAGISAFPMAARVVQAQGQKYDKQNFLLMHAMGANAGGQIGSVAAAAVMLSIVDAFKLVGG